MAGHLATVQVVATLRVPDGYGSHLERRVTWHCAKDAARWIGQASELWDWDEMRMDTEHGTFGRCYCGR